MRLHMLAAVASVSQALRPQVNHGVHIIRCSTSESSRRRISALAATSSKVAPPINPTIEGREGGGDDDGLRMMTADEVKEALEVFESNVPKYCRTNEEKNDSMDLILRMEEWGSTFETFRRLGTRRMTVGSFKRGRLHCIAGLEVKWGRFPEYDVSLIVRLLSCSPKYEKQTVGFEMIDLLKEMSQNNALRLDCSELKKIPSLSVFVLASVKTLQCDPERSDPKKLRYKKFVKRTTFVVDEVPEWADLGPFWYEGRTSDAVSFWFRKRTPALMNEFQVCWDRPEVGNSTGIGTVGGARVIAYGTASACTDIRGWEKIADIQHVLSRKIEREAKRNECLASMN